MNASFLSVGFVAKSKSLRRHRTLNAIVVAFASAFPPVHAEIVDYTTQASNLEATFTDGDAGWYNAGTDLGFYAKATGLKQAAAWMDLTTSGLTTGDVRSLQVGDEFRITSSITRALGQVGFSLNAGGTEGSSYDNRVSGSRMFVNTDAYGSWYVGGLSEGATQSLSYNPSQDTYRNYEFRIFVTSQTTVDVELYVNDGFHSRAYNLTMAESPDANIDGFSMYGSDMWDGDSNDDGFWKNISVRDNGEVKLGYFLGSAAEYTPGTITDGLAANSDNTSRANNVFVGGDAGSQVIFEQQNTYTGSTTVNANATLNLNRTDGASLGATSQITVNDSAKLLISESDQVNNGDTTVSLSGGTIERASGVSETFGALSIGSNSTLNFGSGVAGSLTFGAYSDTSETDDSVLTVDNFFGGNTLKFATNLGTQIDAAFTGTSFTSQNGLFVIKSTSGGFTSNWDGSTFTITAIPEPSTYAAAAGLLAMFLWPVRRRLVKDAKSILGLRPTGRERIEAYRKA